MALRDGSRADSSRTSPSRPGKERRTQAFARRDRVTFSAVVMGRLLRNFCADGRCSAPEVLHAARVETATLDNPDARLSLEQTRALWQELESATADPNVGLSLGASVRAETFDVVGCAMAAANDLDEAFELAARYYRIVETGIDVRFHRNRHTARLQRQVPVEVGYGEHHGEECILAAIVTIGRRLTGVDWSPVRVAFQHPPYSDGRVHSDFFRCPITFGTRSAELVLAKNTLELPLTSANPELEQVLSRCAERTLRRVSDRPVFLDRLRAQVLGAMRAGDLRLETVAARMGISGRTLQRRLEAKQVSFRDIVESVREETALELLTDPRRAVSEIAFLLGYANPSAFHRAFKRKTGQSPTAYRHQSRKGISLS